MPLSSFHFCKIVVTDIEAMEAFYRDAFEFPHRETHVDDQIEEVMLRQDEGGFALCLLRWKDGRSVGFGNAQGMIGFVTPDVDAAVKRALDHGAKLLFDPLVFPGVKLAMLTDPEGHEIELIQFG